MEAKNLGYSLKNIPIPTKQHYLKSMIDKVKTFITRLRWKAYFFEKPDHNNSITQQILVLNQTLHHHRMKKLPVSKIKFMIWCDILNLNQLELIFNAR